MAVIYALIDPRNNDIRYVGYTRVDAEKRLKRHINTARSNKNRYVCGWIRELLKNELVPKMHILEKIADNEIQREAFWIEYGKNNGWKLTNQTVGGNGVMGYEFTDEARSKISKSSKEKWSTPEFREKVINARCGYKHSEETRIKMSKSMTGLKRSKIACENIGKSKLGFIHTEETKEKIRKANKGHEFTKEHCEKISLSQMGNKKNVGRKITEEEKEKARETRRLHKLGIFTEQSRSHHAK